MNKAEKKFRLYAILVIFVLLTVLLSVINGVNFTMASEDADRITQMLADRQGSFENNENMPAERKEKDFRMGPMGPDSPEMNASLRYFTVAVSGKGKSAETVAFHISAVTEEEAKEWATDLMNQRTGWTRGTYRYRVYEIRGTTYVTVIDQGRELLPSFRILIISAIGEVLALVIGWFVLRVIGKKIYAPIEEADRKQRLFVSSVNREFRVPLTVIGANTEISERKHGPDDATRSTRRQLSKLNELVEQLGSIGISDGGKADRAEVSVSDIFRSAIESDADSFAERGLDVEANIAPDVVLQAEPEAIRKMTAELVENSLKFALTRVSFTLKKEGGYVLIETQNDTDLPDGPADRVFDRFVTLENAIGRDDCPGIGLSNVKEIVKAYNGRASASVSGGVFTLRITL